MSEIWKPLDIIVYQNWIGAILHEVQFSLNQWEKDFITSLYHRLDKGNNLSQAQAAKLEDIYVRTS